MFTPHLLPPLPIYIYIYINIYTFGLCSTHVRAICTHFVRPGGEVITDPISITLGSWNHYCAVKRARVKGGIMYYVDGLWETEWVDMAFIRTTDVVQV